MPFTWTRIDDETLALEGHPITIKLLPASEPLRFRLVVDGHPQAQLSDLDGCKRMGQRVAEQLAEFRAV